MELAILPGFHSGEMGLRRRHGDIRPSLASMPFYQRAGFIRAVATLYHGAVLVENAGRKIETTVKRE